MVDFGEQLRFIDYKQGEPINISASTRQEKRHRICVQNALLLQVKYACRCE